MARSNMLLQSLSQKAALNALLVVLCACFSHTPVNELYLSAATEFASTLSKAATKATLPIAPWLRDVA